MGVYIKGMEMPKNGEVITITICDDGIVFDERKEPGRVFKAVPVPPHGDLIDRRETIIDANERAYDFWLSDDEVNSTIQFLNEQIAIVPADAAEEGE